MHASNTVLAEMCLKSEYRCDSYISFATVFVLPIHTVLNYRKFDLFINGSIHFAFEREASTATPDQNPPSRLLNIL